MESGLILSLVGIAISLYALASPTSKRALRYKLSYVHFFFILLLIFWFLYSIVLEAYFSIPEKSVPLMFFGLEVTPDFLFSVAGLLLMLTLVSYFLYLLFFSRLKNVRGFVRDLRRKSDNEEFGLILSDLDTYFDDLLRYHGMKERPEKDDPIYILISGLGSTKPKRKPKMTKKEILKNKLYNRLNRCRILFSIEFDRLLSDLFRNKKFIDYMVRNNPYLGVRIIRSNLRIDLIEEFCEKYLFQLMRNRESVLYHQLRNNQNMMGLYRYIIPQENYVLYTIFNDMKKAEKLSVYRPIGDAVLEYLKEQNRKAEDTENEDDNDYLNRAWRSPIYAGIHFFDIMIQEALAHSIRWHMWLYYLRELTKSITQNINYTNTKGEFANMYEYYLYQIFDAYRSWVLHIEDRNNSYKIKLENTTHEHENGNIIKSSIIAATESIGIIAKSEIREEFKKYLLEIYLTVYFELATSTRKESKRYAKVMKDCIVYEIKDYSHNENLRSDILNALNGVGYDRTKVRMKQGGSAAINNLRKSIGR